MAPPDRIHIFGASGSGVSTLAGAIAAKFGHRHLDVDDYFWEPTNPPFRDIRPLEARQRMLAEVLDTNPRWVLSGSLCGWGDIFIPRFELAIFVLIAHDLRMSRLLAREVQRYGAAIKEGGVMHAQHLEFVEWATKYDTADESMRSRALHEKWMTTLRCRCIRLEDDLTTAARLARLEAAIG
jgi:adenylate kinase family enzyme